MSTGYIIILASRRMNCFSRFPLLFIDMIVEEESCICPLASRDGALRRGMDPETFGTIYMVLRSKMCSPAILPTH
jgi:hypothetical protein